ncbi:MAG: TerC family protein [Planctomycetota bacterium]|jgi:predicted tellurium resistance membrane protein TerC
MEQHIIALIALTAMEIVLGIDNIVFIAILTDRLPTEQRAKARRLGLIVALVMRILLLLSITAVMQLTTPLIDWTDLGVPQSWFEAAVDPTEGAAPSFEPARIESPAELAARRTLDGRDLILLIGGLFLIVKTVREIHHQFNPDDEHDVKRRAATFGGVLFQIALMDLIFSLDSVITAVGMVDEILVMIAAVIVAVGVMVVFADRISNFVSQHPTLKMLALSFLMLIGVMLVAEGIGTHIEKGYIYFAMAFSLLVEFLNMAVRTREADQTPSIEPA